MTKLTDKKSKLNKFKPLSASLIASILFAISPEDVVVAEETEETDNNLKIKALHEEYHSLLNEVEESAAETEESSENVAVEEATEEEATEEAEERLVSEFDEINEVKRLLLHAIEKADTTAYATELNASDLTIDELDEIFEQLIIENVNNESVAEGEIPAVEEDEKPTENAEETADNSDEEALEDIENVEEEETEVPEEEDLEETPEENEADEEETPAVEETSEIAEKVALEESEEQEEADLAEESADDVVEEDSIEGSKDVVKEVSEIEEEQAKEPELETNSVEEDSDEVVSEEEQVEDTENVADPEEDTEETKEASASEKDQETEKTTEAAPASVAMASTMSASADESPVTYTVQSGDTLNKIARAHGVSVNHLVSLNDIANKNNIQVGQILLINGNKDDLGDINKDITNSEFINIVGENARKIAHDHGLYASVMVSQAALESGFGRSGLASAPNYNLFGIKGNYKGESITVRTREYGSNGWVTIFDEFKKYPSYYESLLDNARLLRSGTSWDPQFYDGTWLENADNYSEATDWLEGRYATDPTYATKLNNMIERYNLTQFDEFVSEDVTPSTGDEPTPAPNPGDQSDSESKPDSKPKPKPQPEPEVRPTPSGPTYKVVRGDTLSRIGREYNMSVSELKRLNNLSSDLIYVGQTLKVQEKSSSPESSTPAPGTPSTYESTYKVKSGDTLSGIARTHGVTVGNLMSWNNLDNANLIRVNQTLKIKGQQTAPSKPVEEPESSEKAGETYTVKRGDTLSAISRKYNMSVSELKRLNKLTSDTIYINQTLKVLETKSDLETSTPSKPVSPSTNQTRYTVKSGDTLSGIARNHGVTVSNLMSWNNLDNADVIRVDQKLEIKGQQKAPSKPTGSTGTSASSKNTYTVKSGDTLSAIGRDHNMSVSQLKRLNNLTSDTIYVNQTLKVMDNKSASETTTPSKPVSPSTSQSSYTVKNGDTLSGIARKHDVTVVNLMTWNNLDNADVIRVNQKLKIKGQTSAPSTSSNSSKDSKATNAETYTVKSGDTLSCIARKHNVTVASVMTWNDLDNADVIRVNQKLTVERADNKDKNKSTTAKNKTHKIVSGDTLSGIARQFDTTVRALKDNNNLKTDLIFVGQILKV